MKKLNEWLMMSLLALLLGTSACSAGGEEEEAPAVPTFPTSQTFNVSANSEQIFSFAANMDWKLSSNKTWCTLASSVMEGQNISGQAGSQSVKIKISDEGQDFTETKAAITLSMGGKNQTVAEVIRSAKAYELKVYDAEGNIINTFAITSEGTFEFIVEANFEFGAASVPNWLTIELTVDTNTPSKKNGKITIKEEYFKNPQSATNIVFANELGSASFAIPTTYTGMDSKTIIIKSKDVENGSFWNWNISMDGKTFERNNDLTGTKDEIKEKMTFNVIALNDDYYPIFMEEFEGKYYFEDVNWMHLQKDGETAIFTVDASNKNRNGIALVVPAAVYNEIKNNIEGSILKNDTLKYEYEQKYFLLAFTQKSNTDTSKTGFTVKHGPTWQDIQCTPETDNDLLEYIGGSYSVQEIYSMKVPADYPLLIWPNMSESEWDMNENSFFINWLDGKTVSKDNLGGTAFGPALDDKENPYLTMRTPKSFTQAIFVVFKGTDSLNKKVLIIKPQ